MAANPGLCDCPSSAVIADRNSSDLTGAVVSLPPWSEDANASSSIWDSDPPSVGIESILTYSIHGDAPVIITAPHGGNLSHNVPDRQPINTPDKTNVRRVCTETDHNTAQLACAVAAKLREKGVNASLVVGKMLRSKVDLNRPESICAESHLGFTAWHEYHGEVKAGVQRALEQHPYAHVFDLHGQGHRPATEVGHMLPNRVLRDCCGCAIDAHAKQSSYAAMTELPNFSMNRAVRGPSAMGSLLEARGFPAVPSEGKPHPCSCDPACGCPCSGYDAAAWSGTGPDCGRPCAFFWGGTTSQMYGGGVSNPSNKWPQISDFVGKVSATQMETLSGGRTDDATILRFAEAIADSIVQFMKHFYNYQPRQID